ncbi:MAG TPA: excinuclease ABC subunit UvrC [Longimicrobiales bacterium]
MDLQDRLRSLSTRPGVYLFKDAQGEVLYVGKAKNLRSRVRSYFRADAGKSLKTAELARRIEDLDTLVVGSEAEALILEANLIKEHRPRFNLLLRDDKSYPYIKVTVKEPFPRVWVTRRLVNDGSRYFGPYTDVGRMRQALEVVKRLYTVRSCRYDLPREAPDRPCLDYHIGRCKAPCVGLQSETEYRDMVNEILHVLSGETEDLRRGVEERMRRASEELDFERAARLRDVLRGLDALARDVRVERFGGGDVDVVGLARDGALATAAILRVRSGAVLGRDTLRFGGLEDEDDTELLAGFLSRYYLGGGEARIRGLPREILLPSDFEDRELLGEVLSGEAGRRVHVSVPQRGDKRRLVGLAADNARHALEDRMTALAFAADRADQALYSLQEELDLKVVPRFMVCFDVSHTQGAETVASVVAFENGEPRKAEYRHMKIRGEWGNDDYASMHEAVHRYVRRRLDESRPLPDLCVIDGGKGQLGAAATALKDLGAEDVQLLALAKKEEEVFLRGRKEPVRLSRRNRALHLLQRIRDEAHRFAVSYNRKLRSKRTLRSDLGDIPGIGPARQKALLTRFGSLKGVRDASVEDIARVPGFSRVLASRILTWLGR